MEPGDRERLVDKPGPALAKLEELVPPKPARDEGWRDEALLRSLARRMQPADLDLLRSITSYRGDLVLLSLIAADVGRSLDETWAGLDRLRDLGLVGQLGGTRNSTWFTIPDDEYRVVERLTEFTRPRVEQEPVPEF